MQFHSSGAPRPLARLATLGLAIGAALSGCEPQPSNGAPAPGRYEVAVNSIVDVQTALVVGGSIGRRWVQASEITDAPKAGESWWLYEFDRTLGQFAGSRPGDPEYDCNGSRVEFADLRPREHGALAIKGEWNGTPRQAVPQGVDHPAYLSLLNTALAGKTVAAGNIVRLRQNLRVDINADGVDEVLLVASNLTADAADAPAGGYSVVLMRAQGESGPQVSALAENYYPDGCQNCAPVSHRLEGLVDLNGDGNVEVFLRSSSQQMIGGSLLDWVGDGLERKFEWTCDK